MNMFDIPLRRRPEIYRRGLGTGLSVLGMVFLAGCQTIDDEIPGNGPPVVSGSVDGASRGSAPAGLPMVGSGYVPIDGADGERYAVTNVSAIGSGELVMIRRCSRDDDAMLVVDEPKWTGLFSDGSVHPSVLAGEARPVSENRLGAAWRCVQEQLLFDRSEDSGVAGDAVLVQIDGPKDLRWLVR